MHAIDEEIRSIIDSCYERSRQILEDNMDKLHLMADALMKYETIDRKQIDEIMQGHEPGPPESWSDSDPSGPGNGGSGASVGQDEGAGESGTGERGGGQRPDPGP